MPISHKHKCIFIHIPKNAGTSITNSLEMEDAGHHLFGYYMKRYSKDWPNYKKFAVIRNPWDRVFSCYTYARQLKSFWHSPQNDRPYGIHPDYATLINLTFDKCIRLLHKDHAALKHHGWTNQLPYVSLDNKLIIDEVVDVKDVKKYIKEKFKVDALEINRSPSSKHYKDYYTPELIELVSEIYREDIKFFNFKY